MAQATPRGRGTAPDVGRCSMLDEPAERARVARIHLLDAAARYGVVFREMLSRETIVPRWRELLITFRRLEDRGEIRGGRFVSGFLGEQFALPVAVESLRATRKLSNLGEAVTISAADPLNLVGVSCPASVWRRVQARS